MIIMALLLMSSIAGATDYKFNKKVQPSDLQDQIVAAGITLDAISCAKTACTVWNASADPSAVIASYVYVDPALKIQSNKAAAIALVKKLRVSTATQAEKDELLSRLAFIILGQ